MADRKLGRSGRGRQPGARTRKSPTDPSAPVLNGQLPSPGISVLDRLIKTCPVWLQLCMSPEQAAETLHREASGVFLVTRDVDMKCMVLWVHHSARKEADEILRYNIREQRTMMYLEGSVLVFKDVFKLVAFYCVSRDILPSPLRLPCVISSAQSFKDLEVISNLGSGFWDSSSRHQRASSSRQSAKSPSPVHRSVSEAGDCTCERAASAGRDKLWFVDPIFIEECSNLQSSAKLPLANCEAKSDEQLPKIVYRRPPPPPPPPLHKPPLPSVPPSAPPPIYKPSHPHTGSPSHSRLSSSGSKPIPLHPTSPTESLPLVDLSNPSLSAPVLPCSSPTSPKVEPLTPGPLDQLSPTSSLSLASPPNSIPADPILLDSAATEPLDDISPPEMCPGSPPPSAEPLRLTQTDFPLALQLTQTDFPLAPSASETVSKAQYFEDTSTAVVDQSLRNMRINSVEEKKEGPEGSKNLTPAKIPPVVPRRRQSGKVLETKTSEVAMKKDLEGRPSPTSPDLKILKPEPKLLMEETCVSDLTQLENQVTVPEQQSKNGEHGQKTTPIPPPRRNKLSAKYSSTRSGQGKVDRRSGSETQRLSKSSDNLAQSGGLKNTNPKECRDKRLSSEEQKGSDLSLNSTDTPLSNPDSISNSSTEEDVERPVGSPLKKSHSFMLDRAKNRLSIVTISNVFSAFMSADRKLGKRIGELAHDKDSYFGNLVQDYKAYSLEMMAKQSSSTEMLQEIRLMMTQLKSYLVQSTELKSMVDYNIYTDDKIDTIVEAALCKCVLKPLKSPIECYLREIHNKDGSMRLMTENQLVIQDTTTTDLGVTTSVPDSGVMEKIMQKFLTMHKTYSPEKKITYLLKSCKLIYDSMASGNPGKPHGADDFLPVLMYVLARCDLVALLLDVEYMMELMDPALQLGEGSYYLTTTYGALEHIKNYDKITVTRQLSVEVQDSIHRWERRRTLNKARVSRSSIQDFITVSFEELDSKTRTLATKPETSVTQVLQQCAEKFEVSDPENYGLFVLVHDRCFRLAEDASPHQVKSALLKNEQKLDFHFLYKMTSLQDTLLKELDSI